MIVASPCVRFKSGVTFGDPPTAAQVRLLAVCDEAARHFGRDVWVTAGRNDHELGAHPLGRAIDVRTRDWADPDTAMLYDFLSERLGHAEFYVQYETPVPPHASSPLKDIAEVNPTASAPHIHAQVRSRFSTWPERSTSTVPV